MTLIAVLAGPLAAQNCTGREFDGTYGFALSGQTKISGKNAPAVGVGRIATAADGTVSGYSSVNFEGWLLGNPVTGTYDLTPDCTLTLNLQDDSGGWQHFKGEVTAGGAHASVRQTDPGTGEEGVLDRAPTSCSDSQLRTAYTLTLSGAHTPVNSPGTAKPVSATSTLTRDYRGVWSITWNPGTPQAATVPATVNVQSDCTVEFAFPSQAGDPIKLRGIIVRGATEILAIRTDPNQTVSAHFVAK